MEKDATPMDMIVAEVIEGNKRRQLEESVVPKLNDLAIFNALTMNTAVNT